MAIEKVKEYFAQFGIADRMQEFDVSSATVELAAQALNCEPCRIAKKLSFMVDGHAILIVAAGDCTSRRKGRSVGHLSDCQCLPRSWEPWDWDCRPKRPSPFKSGGS